VANHELYTTGYSGHDVDSFVRLLRRHDISVVVDIRRNPVSRKKGFSRTALSQVLEKAGLKYVHVKELGVPQPLRHQYRDGDCNLADYLCGFREYLQGQTDPLEKVYNLATNDRCCLVCVEACHKECHRSVVAEEVATHNGHTVKIVHL
jgi:uncharacterized protein (DUF488 family)